MRADALGIRKLDLRAARGRLQFCERPGVDPMAVIRLIQGQPRHYRMDGPDKLRITIDLPDAATRFNAARGLLTALRTDAAECASKLQERREPLPHSNPAAPNTKHRLKLNLTSLAPTHTPTTTHPHHT